MNKMIIKATLAICSIMFIAAPMQTFAAESLDSNQAVKDWLYNKYGIVISKPSVKPPVSQPPVSKPEVKPPVTKPPVTKPEVKPPTSAPEVKPPATKPPTTTPEVKPPVSQPGNDAQLEAYEKKVAELVNKERVAAGLPPLKVNLKLSQVAEKKAEDMRDKKYFSHNSPTYGSPFDMMKKFGISYKTAGENIAKGQKTPEAVMKGWMNSSGHRANIMSTGFTEIGIGFVTDSKGDTHWVQMFIRP